jgi:hypothetical protein
MLASSLLKSNGGLPHVPRVVSSSFRLECEIVSPSTPILLRLTSDQVGIPAELKHINKRRKRNQQGLPQ